MAPSALLSEWIKESGVRPYLIAACWSRDRERKDAAQALVQEVLDRKPLTEDHAAVLERGTFIPARFWLALEHNYRAGLAAGLKDCTAEDAAVAPESHVIYCKGCQRAWRETIVRPLAEEDHSVSACSCTCADDTDPHYEDWVVDPGPDAIPEGAWEWKP